MTVNWRRTAEDVGARGTGSAMESGSPPGQRIRVDLRLHATTGHPPSQYGDSVAEIEPITRSKAPVVAVAIPVGMALFDAGLDSIRVSINSLREDCYKAYFRPRGYTFADIMLSVDKALERGGHVALNYLNLPGFTDTPQEYEALAAFLTDRTCAATAWSSASRRATSTTDHPSEPSRTAVAAPIPDDAPVTIASRFMVTPPMVPAYTGLVAGRSSLDSGCSMLADEKPHAALFHN